MNILNYVPRFVVALQDTYNEMAGINASSQLTYLRRFNLAPSKGVETEGRRSWRIHSFGALDENLTYCLTVLF